MDKITKAINKFSAKEKSLLKIILKKINNNDYGNLNIKKLKGHKSIYRVRQGKIRIIFMTAKNKNIFILAIERRSENTYKF